MKYLLYFFTTLLFFVGCSVPGGRDKFDRTPGGWHVHWLDQGTESTGLHTKAEILSLFDAAMERSFPECATHVGLPESYVRKAIHDRDALYTLVDNAWFAVGLGSSDAPNAVYASGLTEGRTHVTVAFYNLTSLLNGSTFPPEAPSWTFHAGIAHPDRTYFGVELDGLQYPALGYELHWQFTQNP